MLKFFKNALGITPIHRKIIGHFYFKSETNGEGVLDSKIHECHLFLNEYQTNSYKIEVKSLDNSSWFHVAALPFIKDDNVIYILKEDKTMIDYMLSINEENAFLHRKGSHSGTFYSISKLEPKQSPEKKKQSSIVKEKITPLTNRENSNEITFQNCIKKEFVIYRQTRQSEKDWEIVIKDGKYGLLDCQTGNYILEPQYYLIKYFEIENEELEESKLALSYFQVHDNVFVEKCYILTDTDNYTYFCLAMDMKGIMKNQKPYFSVKKSHKIGFCNGKGEFVILPKFYQIGELSARNTGVYTWGKFHENFFKYYFIDIESGNYKEFPLNKESDLDDDIDVYLDNQKLLVSPFTEDLAIFQSNNKYGLINHKAEIVYPSCMNLKPVINLGGIAIVQKGDQFYPISKEGVKLTNLNYDFIGNNYYGFFLTKIRGFYGIINENGYTVLPTVFNEIIPVKPFELKIFRVLKEGKVSFVKSRNENQNENFYDYTNLHIGNISFFGGLLRVKKNGLIGYLNENLEEVIPCKYEKGSRVLRGKICVVENGKKFILDREGEILKHHSNFSDFPYEDEERLVSNQLEVFPSPYKM